MDLFRIGKIHTFRAELHRVKIQFERRVSALEYRRLPESIIAPMKVDPVTSRHFEPLDLE
jgi:hypothetical protein